MQQGLLCAKHILEAGGYGRNCEAAACREEVAEGSQMDERIAW